jgi:hypothetical protein
MTSKQSKQTSQHGSGAAHTLYQPRPGTASRTNSKHTCCCLEGRRASKQEQHRSQESVLQANSGCSVKRVCCKQTQAVIYNHTGKHTPTQGFVGETPAGDVPSTKHQCTVPAEAINCTHTRGLIGQIAQHVADAHRVPHRGIAHLYSARLAYKTMPGQHLLALCI